MPALARARRAPAKALAPQADPRFQKLLAQIKTGASKAKQHPPPAKKAAEAQAAAKGPPNEKLAGAKAKQVDKMKEAEGKKPEASGFVAMLRAEIEKVMPKNLEDATKFMQGDEKEQIKGAAEGNVSKQKSDAAGPVQQASTQAPSAAGVPTKEGKPIPGEPAQISPGADAANAVPAPKPDAEISQEQTKKDADQQLKEAKVTPEQLKKANDPRFSAVLEAKSSVDKVAAASPGKYRAGEKAALVAGVSKASAEAKKGLAAVATTKTRSSVTVKSKQQLAKEKDEAERKKVTDTIEGIYNETKAAVEKKLSSLETDVSAIFDRGIDAALASMQAYAKARIDQFYDERYTGIRGAARWLVDKFRDTPEGVKQILREARTRFTGQMDALAVKIGGIVDGRLKDAKAEVAKGQKRIDTYVKGLPKNLQAVGKEAQNAVADRFKELEQGIDNKAQELAEKLAQKYKEAHDKADELSKKIEEENQGAFKGLIDKLGEVVKAIMEFKARLMAVLKKGQEAIELILKDPIGFLGNLIAALKQGFKQFAANILTHLKRGFMEWLFGSLAGAGIQLPSDLSLPSILKLVLDVLGLTYAWIRSEAVKLIGERGVTIIEKLVEYISVTIRGGPAALWEKVKEDIGNLKSMVIDAIQDWIISTIIKQAVIKVVSMFNPAGALVQAVIMIVNVVMFVVERASQIMALVEAVVNSVHAIASGSIGGAANWIEQALARLIPLAISLLASLIGLGGISAKIKGFITKVQGKVRGAVLKWLKKALLYVKKLFGTGRRGAAARGQRDETRDEEGEAIDLPAPMQGASHTLSADKTGTDISMASAKKKLSAKLGTAVSKVKAEKAPTPKQQTKKNQRVAALQALQTSAKAAEKKLKKGMKKAQKKAILDPIVVQIVNYATKFEAKDVEEVLAKEFPGPRAGTYTDLTGYAAAEKADPKRVLPDDTTREAHHAPPVVLGQVLAKELKGAGQDLNKTVAGSGTDLLTASADLAAATGGGGATLPAILVHQQTHRIKPSITGRIHGSELKPKLLAALASQGYTLAELTTTSTGTGLSVKPGEPAFRRQLQRTAKKALNLNTIRKALKTDARTLVKTFFDAAVAQSIGAVQAAVSASVVDGPAGERSSAITKLKSLAKSVWWKKILSVL